MSNAEQIFEEYFNNAYKKKGNNFYLNKDNEILDNGTIMAKIVEYEDNEADRYYQMCIISLQDFKYDKTWNAHRKALVKAANKYGLIVVFVPSLDMGFGLALFECLPLQIYNTIHEILLSLYKLSEGNKNAIGVIATDECIYEPAAYAFTQIIDGEEISAEKVLSMYLNGSIFTRFTAYCLVEPNADGLMTLLNCGVDKINYYELQKEYTQTHIQLTNDIMSHQILSSQGKPIIYSKITNRKVMKFFEKRSNI